MAANRLWNVSLRVAGGVARRAPAAASYALRMGREATAATADGMPAGYTVQVIDTDAEFDALEVQWLDLETRAHSRGPFVSWHWLHGWWREIGHPVGYDLRIITVRHCGRLVGVGPYYLDEDRFGAKLLRSLGDTLVGSEYLDMVHDADHADAVAEAISVALQSGAGVDAIMLYDLDGGSPVVQRLCQRTAGLVGLELEGHELMPCVRIAGDYEAYSKTLSSNMRYNLRRKQRKLAQVFPEYRFRVVDAVDDLPHSLTALFRLHRRRWATKGKPGNFSRPEVQAFHRRVAPALLTSGVLRLYLLEMSPGTIGAVLYCLRRGDREFYLQAGMDPEYGSVAAGFCLMKLVIERCANEGIVEFDMLRGTESYKRHWANAEHTTVRVSCARATPKGLLWAGRRRLREQLVKIVKDEVPAELLESFRGWQERLGQPDDTADAASTSAP